MDDFESLRRTPDAVDLFMFSAAQWLLHRIHYDSVYATESEGHPAVLVHGPLQAVYLTQLIRHNLGPGAVIRTFTYRHLRPVYLGQRLTCGGRIVSRTETGQAITCEVWTEHDDGTRATEGVAEVTVGSEGSPTDDVDCENPGRPA
jgi:hydroxyacyl-ACP dehydratase HTD2-like protein with hotdog domain